MAAPHRILLIEHDRATREVVTAALDEDGHDVTPAASLDDGVTLLRAGRFDLVLTDDFTVRPGDVLTTTAPVRNAAGDTPVVLMTAHPLTLEEARAAGFSDLLTKPFDLAMVDAVIEDLLGP